MKNNLHITGVEQTFPAHHNILSTTNLAGKITYINKDFIQISGFTSDELIGQNHHIVRHPDMPAAVFKMFWTDLRADKSWMGIVKNRCKNGDHYWVDAYVTPIKKNGTTEEYQSVRRKAKPEYIQRAAAVYRAIKAGKPLRHIADAMPLPAKLMLAVAVCALVPALAVLLSATTIWLLSAVVLAAVLGCGAVFWCTQPLMQFEPETSASGEHSNMGLRLE